MEASCRILGHVKYLLGGGTRWARVERGFEEKLIENGVGICRV